MKSVDAPNYKYNGQMETPPQTLNLDALPLFKEEIRGNAGTSNNGRLLEVRYYRNQDLMTGVYSDLVIKEVITYTDVNDFLAIKQMDVYFYKEDDSVGIVQTKFKFYSTDEGMLKSIEEGQQRREYLIKKGKLYLLNEIGISAGIALFSLLKGEIEEYENVNNQPLLFSAIDNVDPLTLTTLQKETLKYILAY